ncbi:hypothetical protein MKW98_027660 [Papaver atlanticum]|uniref:TCP domain-containing protein n=1 Tax=Papaver atlanticum TaxID=357466 RepID=A0AAD4SU56_9MAGN|nr:hypothetical protein MKW98_027660 [Papaver atlanticum]
MEDIPSHHHQPCKLSRITSNSRNDSNKIGRTGSADQHPQQQKQDSKDEEAADGGQEQRNPIISRAWQSSRIFKVSKASGGKDRHSKVLTTKGVRDRRVRLSVSTAIQFYDLQDRLGYDQPSKAIDWLIKAAANAIAQLPSLNAAFLYSPKQPSDEKRIHRTINMEPTLDMAEVEFEMDSAYNQQQQHNLSASKLACSSTSDIRAKARERTANDKEKEKPDEAPTHHHISSTGHRQPNSQSPSFTELLTGAQHNNSSSSSAAEQNYGFSNPVFNKQHRPLVPTQMDYFSVGDFGGATLRNNHHYSSSGFSTQTDYGSAPQATPCSMKVPPPPFTVTADHHNSHHRQNQQHPEMRQFSFLSEHLIPDTDAAAADANGNEYNLNFTIAAGIAGFSRVALQSNLSQSPLSEHFQPRFSSSPSDGPKSPNMPLFMGNVGNADSCSITPEGNQFPSGLDGGLQL